MSTGAAAGCRDKKTGAYRYQRHQPENTLLYQIVERYYPEFTAYLAEQGAILPRYVQREFEAYLKCGRLEHGLDEVTSGIYGAFGMQEMLQLKVS